MLNAKTTKEEVKQALFQFSGDKAPRLDGYPAGFYQKCWHIIGDEVLDALEAARNAGNFPKEINNTFLALIPKKENPSKWEEFKPISLCNMTYKLLSKIMANRLKKLLPVIISKEQTRFVPNRSILDGIIIVQEAIHSIQNQRQPNMLIKLDIKKAYDKVDWYFICSRMKAFGFNR